MDKQDNEVGYLWMTLQRLKEITKECRPDMHEPDEQGLSAHIVGDHLDNAGGNKITASACEGKYQEYVLILRKENKIEKFNLATLIALARRANLKYND